MFSKSEAARLLGMAESEVVKVQGTKYGTVIHTFDGNALIHVAERDSAGNEGLMFLVPPHNRYDESKSPMKVFKRAADEVSDDEDELTPAQRRKLAEVDAVLGELDGPTEVDPRDAELDELRARLADAELALAAADESPAPAAPKPRAKKV